MIDQTEQKTDMQFKQGTHVYTSDNQDVGSVERVVLDPISNKVRGLVVRKGWLFSDDKVVPIELVETATEDRVTLRRSEANLHKLPEFEETYYIPADEHDYRDDDAITTDAYASPLYGYPPIGTAWWGYGAYLGYPPVEFEPDFVERVQQNIPEGTVALKEGARVLSREGKHVGNVEEIFTDSATQRATHFIISQGLVFKERKLIPTNWVKETGEDEVRLTVSTDVVNKLPEYR